MTDNATLTALATVTLSQVMNNSFAMTSGTQCAAVLDGNFVLLGDNYTGALYREAGGVWSAHDDVLENRDWAMAHALGSRLAMATSAGSGNRMGYTDDVTSWSGSGESVLSGLGTLSYGQMIEVDGKLHVCTNTHFLTSLDGGSWSGAPMATTIVPRGMVKANAGFVTACYATGLYTSPDGVALAHVAGTESRTLFAVASTGDKVLATDISTMQGTAFLSIDGGASFNPVVLPNELWGVRVADAIGGGFIVLSATHLGLSADGESWDVTALSTVPGIAGGEFWTSIAVDGNRFVVSNGNSTGPILVGEVTPPSGPFWTGLINCEVVA